MTRAALLPFCGDPFLLKKWLECFDIWKDEIDTLYVCINGEIKLGIMAYCNEQLMNNPKIKYLNWHINLDHGPAINKMLDQCQEDLVMLIEEDAFIFKKGQVDKCFMWIENDVVDIVGSERGSTTEEIIRAASRRFDCEYPGFWPNFFFIKRENLLKTDRHFQAKSWNKGDYIKELDLTISDEVAPADTFVWTSIQLRSMGMLAKLVPQYHSVIDDIQDKVQIKGIFDRKCPWFHIGSLSGWQHVLFDDLAPRLGEVEEWERRASAWLMFWEDAQPDLPESLQEFSKQYKSGIDRLIKEYTLSLSRVEHRTKLYRYLLNGK